MYTELSYDVDGHVGVITLRRPEARNALTFTTYRELEDAVRNAAVRCLIITGADPAFCSGDDVKQIMAGGEGARPAVTNLAPRLTPAADALLHTDIPIIAAVNGAAIGWGMELSLMADIRVASEKARFVNCSSSADYAATYRESDASRSWWGARQRRSCCSPATSLMPIERCNCGSSLAGGHMK